MKLDSIPVLHPQVAAQIVDDQAVIVLADAAQVTMLNAVGTRVWELSDGAHTVAQIAEHIAAEFDVPREQALCDVAEFLEALVRDQMMEFHDQPIAKT